jgi:hypothetical protein
MPNEIVLRFINEADLVSRLIDWTTRSIFCHVEALSRDGSHWIGAHARTGVEARPLDWVRPSLERRYALPVPPAAYEQAMAWLESKLGTPYDYADIAGLALGERRFEDTRAVDCSALMMGFLQQAGYQPLNCLENFDYLVTPETLHLSPIFMNRLVATASIG